MLAKWLFIAILAAGLACAQRGGGGGGGRGGGGGNIPMTFASGSRLDRIAEAFKLSKEQKKELKATLDAAQREATPVHDQLLKSRQTIAEAVAAGKSQDEIAPLITADSMLDAQIAAIELKAFTTIFKALDKDQRTRPAMPMFFQSMNGIFDGKNWNSADEGR